MKKLFFAAAVLMCSLTAFAQTKEGSFNILPKAGINISTLSNKDNAEVRIRDLKDLKGFLNFET